MRIRELIESADLFNKIMIHETTPEAAKQIKANGFKMPTTGVFFNTHDVGYTGGTYGGTQVTARIIGPVTGILNLEDDDNLPDDLDELADGHEIAKYARVHGFWAWTDGIQFAVLDKNHINVL